MHGALKEKCTLCRKRVYIGEVYSKHIQEQHLRKRCVVRLQRLRLASNNIHSQAQQTNGIIVKQEKLCTSEVISEKNVFRKLLCNGRPPDARDLDKPKDTVEANVALVKTEPRDSEKHGSTITELSRFEFEVESELGGCSNKEIDGDLGGGQTITNIETSVIESMDSKDLKVDSVTSVSDHGDDGRW